MQEIKTCEVCNGTGSILVDSGNNDNKYYVANCPNCNGKGYNIILTE